MKKTGTILAGFLACMIFLSSLPQVMAEDWEYDDDPPFEIESTTVAAENTTSAPAVPVTVPMPAPTTTEPSTAAIDPPFVLISRENLAQKPKPGETFSVSVSFHNYSNQVALIHGAATFEPSEGLSLAEKTATKAVPVLNKGDVGSVTVHLRVGKDVTEAQQTVTVLYSYSYRTADGLQQAEKSEKLMIEVAPSRTGAADTAATHATPNIIVTNYAYGGTIAAGDNFTLDLKFRNTSKDLPAENIIMAVETGDGLSITSASNTYYFARIGANQTLSGSIPMRVSPNADASGAKIEITFRYEYIDNGTRTSTSTNESLSIPIYAPDRFILTQPDTVPYGVQNQELAFSLSYVNKGKLPVNNVQAELIYDDASVLCEQPRQLLGNIEAGKSGTIDFYFVPSESGEQKVSVKITYENEMVEEKTRTFEIACMVDELFEDEPMWDDGPVEDLPQQGGIAKSIGIAAAVLVVAVVVIVLLVKKRKKKAVEAVPQFDWGLPQTANEESTHETH